MKATWMLGLYPAAWRHRYEAEFRALLDDQDISLMESFDIAFGALDAHLRPQHSRMAGAGGGGAPPPAPADADAVAAARRRVDELKLFYAHIVFYVTINLLLLVINWLTTPNVPWVLFPLWGWGIALAVHAGLTFRWRDLFGAHLATFAVVNAGLLTMNWVFGGYPWSLWVLVSLSILLLAHALLGFGVTDLFGAHVVTTGLVAIELVLVAAITPEDFDNIIWVILSLVALVIGHAVLRARQASLYQVHLVTFVVVNAMLFLENLRTDDGVLWFQYPLIAWSVLLAIHTLVHVRLLGFPDDDWERARLNRLGVAGQPETAAAEDTSPESAALRERVRVHRELLLHLFFFGVGAIDLAVLNIVSSPGTLWMIWPVGVWAVLLAGHLGYALITPRLFGAHLFGAIAGSLGLIAIDVWTGGGAWAYWPILGLGLTVVVHALFAFNARRVVDQWEARRIAGLLK